MKTNTCCVNLPLEPVKVLTPDLTFTSQQDNNPKHAASATVELFRSKHIS